jgi:RNA polymerase sigma factor (sigma-70 family)
VAAALAGDQAAWQQIVDRHAGLVWSVVRGFRLDQAEACDVAQTVWLRLVENLPRVHQPAALPGWLATTARRESIRALRRSQREIPSEDHLDDDSAAPSEDSRRSTCSAPSATVRSGVR